MSRQSQSIIERHPQKEEIEKALIEGWTYREITAAYGVGKNRLSEYARGKFVEALAAGKKARKEWDGDRIVNEIEEVMEKAKRMLDACDEWLQDPDAPGKYNLDPRGHEVEIVYYDTSSTAEDEKPIRRRRPLQQVLDDIAGAGRNPIEVKISQADPRKLILDSVNSLSRLLEVMGRVRGEIQDVTYNISTSEVWISFQSIILEALRDYPEAKERLADKLRAHASDDSVSRGA